MKLPRYDGSARLRSRMEWAVRGCLVAVIATLGTGATCFTVAKVSAARDPAWAHLISPGDGQVTAAYALALAGPEAEKSSYPLAERLARQALRQDATAGAAVDALGLIAQSRGNSLAEHRFFAYAQKLSRRSVMTQLWSIEDAVNRNDIPEALRWYNTALRTNPEMSKLLFPVLVGASGEAAIRGQLIRTLATRPSWSADFLRFVPNNAADPRVAVMLFGDMRRAGVVIPAQAASALVDRLLNAKQYDLAWQYYSQARGKGDRLRSRDPGFSARPAVPSLLDWNAVTSGGISVLMDNNALEFSAPTSVGGAVVQQVQLLPPGSYRLSGRSEAIDLPTAARPYWALTCGLGQGPELGRVIMPGNGSADGGFSGTLSVPAACPVQTLTLIAQPVDLASGLTDRVDQIQLRPE